MVEAAYRPHPWSAVTGTTLSQRKTRIFKVYCEKAALGRRTPNRWLTLIFWVSYFVFTRRDRGNLPKYSSNSKSAGDVPMNKAICILLCAVITLLQSSAAFPQTPVDHGGKIVSKYDGFALETVMRLEKMKVTCDGFTGNFKTDCVSMDVTLHFPGIQMNHVKNVTLQLLFETRNWNPPHPPDQRELSVVADTTTFRLGTMRAIRAAPAFKKEKTLETLEATVPYDLFRRIALSESIEFQVGNTKFELREKNVAALRDLNSRVLSNN